MQQLEDGAQKAERAREAVVALKRLVEEHDTAARDKEETERKRKEASERLNRSKAVLLKLEDVKRRYTALVLSSDPPARGLELEKIMYDNFEVFDLDPKASFRLKGEQMMEHFHSMALTTSSKPNGKKRRSLEQKWMPLPLRLAGS